VIIIIVVLSFGAICFLVMAALAESPRARKASQWVREQVIRTTPEPVHKELAKSLYERTVVPLLARTSRLVADTAPRGVLTEAERRLQRAGWPFNLTAPLFVACRLICIVAAIPLGLVLSNMLPLPPLLRLGALLFIIGGGVILPGLVMDRIAAKRRAAIRRALPNAIDLLVVSVEAGMGLDGAVQQVVKRETGPFTDELRVVLTEVRLGKRRRDAWRAMAERVDLTELNVFVAALCQAEQLGASISAVLRIQSETMRARRSITVREAGAKIPIKMLFPLIFFIFPSMFVVMLGPGVIKMIETFKAIGF